MHLDDYLPQRVNEGPWLSSYTLDRLNRLEADVDVVLPICSFGTPCADVTALGDLHLPPLYHEALDERLKTAILRQIERCFPAHELSRRTASSLPALRVVELPPAPLPAPSSPPQVLAFSVDTAVEEHGPHLPLATDTIQSYGALSRLTQEYESLRLGPPVEYGQLTWGLPFGFSIDLTAELLAEYVTRFTDALDGWLHPEAVYVVDVHGSIVHRKAIVTGLERSSVERWAFRWLHEPLAEFASGRGDQHAGGVETALIERLSADLLDRTWWPERIEEIAAGQMSFEQAVELTQNLPRFFDEVDRRELNGVVGDIGNYRRLDAAELFNRMLSLARSDVDALLGGAGASHHDAGEELW